jgi:hypothetical protein
LSDIIKVDRNISARFNADGALIKEETLLCPECLCNNIHVIGVKVATNDIVHTITSEGYKETKGKTAETSEATNRRGNRIYIEYYCEYGHHGYIILQFHKGCTNLEHEQLPEETVTSDIWRD